MTGSEAVCYEWSVGRYAEIHRGPGSWYTTDHGRDRTRFAVSDESGRVVVDPADAWFGIAAANGPTSPPDRRTAVAGGRAGRSRRVDTGEALPDHVAAFCREESRFDPDAAAVDGDTKFSEQTVEPGESVLVVGEAEGGRSADGYATTVVRGPPGTRSSPAGRPRWYGPN